MVHLYMYVRIYFGRDDSWRKSESPFDNHPQLARKNSRSHENLGSHPVGSTEPITHFDFKPLGGVTFQKNRNSDVQIVGKGYAEDSQPAEPKPSTHATKAKDRRRVSKSEYFFLIFGCYRFCDCLTLLYDSPLNIQMR